MSWRHLCGRSAVQALDLGVQGIDLLALGLTLLMVRLLNKKVNPVWLIFALFGLGIIGNALGFLS